MKYFILFCALISQAFQAAYAKEELVVVQTVSVDQKSFVIGKGIKDGISLGQLLIFANEDVSLVCKAIEVNRNYSYWRPVNENMSVPFLREEIVSSNSHIYGSIGLDLVADKTKMIEDVEFAREMERFRKQSHYSLRASLGAGISQSASSVGADQNPKRTGYDASLEYNFRIDQEYEVGLGMRYDSETYRLTNPTLDIPSTRLMAVGMVTYHFVQWTKGKNNVYLSLVGGIGTSQTIVNEQTNSGTATLLPQMRLGYLMPFSKQNAMLFEMSIESISTKETLPDSSVQTSSYVNAKGTIGITF